MINQRWENAKRIKQILADNQDHLDDMYGLRIAFFIDIPSNFVICCVYKMPTDEMIGVLKFNPYRVFHEADYIWEITHCDIRNINDLYPIDILYTHTLTEDGRKAIENG